MHFFCFKLTRVDLLKIYPTSATIARNEEKKNEKKSKGKNKMKRREKRISFMHNELDFKLLPIVEEEEESKKQQQQQQQKQLRFKLIAIILLSFLRSRLVKS